MNQALAGIVAFIVGAAGATFALQEGGFGVTVAADDPCAGTPPFRTCVSGVLTNAPRPVGEAEAQAGVAAPSWREGQAWRVLFGEGESACTVVVVEANESGYRHGFSCRGADRVAAQVATWREGWIGEMTRDLEGATREGEMVRWFDWPLTDGKQWSSELFGEEYEFTAEYAPDVQGPNGPEPGYLLRATAEGREDAVLVSYNYVPSIGWWSHMEWASGYVLNVVDFEQEWSGRATSGVSTLRLDESGFAGAHAPLSAATTFELPRGEEVLVLQYRLGNLNYANVEVVAPSGETRHRTTQQQFLGTEGWTYDTIDGEAGTWEIRLSGANFGSASFRAYGITLLTWEL